jgi:hypothetical protein
MGAKSKTPLSEPPSKAQLSLSASPVFFVRNNSMTKSMSNKKPSSKFLTLKNKIEQQLIPKFPDQAFTKKDPKLSGTIPKASCPGLTNSSKTPVKPNIQSIHETLFKKSLDQIKGELRPKQKANSSSNNNISSSSNKNRKAEKEGSEKEATKAKRSSVVNVKPKMIDLEFKNELEKLFADGNPMRSRKPAPQKTKTFEKTGSTSSLKKAVKSDYNQAMEVMETDKLRGIFSVIAGHSINDYSDLLVDFKDNGSCAESGSKLQENNLIMLQSSQLKTLDSEKLVQYLIQILVKSCRVFDVATSADGQALCYWRYANPIVAAYKTSNGGKRRESEIPQLVNSSTQTAHVADCRVGNRLLVKVTDSGKSSANNNSTTTDNRSLAQSIIEVLTDTLSYKSKNRLSYRLKKFRLQDKSRNVNDSLCSNESSNLNCKYTSFSGMLDIFRDILFF